ncbi:MAG: DUF6282 family protein [Candidatus Acidiferrales bacterium]|jgi:hypothetical protein
MNSQWSCILFRQTRWALICWFLLMVPAHGQSEINLTGAIDTRVHSSPDSAARSIDADDLARIARDRNMRGLVLKDHFESTAALAYMVRKEVPGIEVFGGIVLNRSVGGINLDAVKRMILIKGGWGRVVWLPTTDSESFVKKLHLPGASLPVPVSQDGHLLSSVLELIDFIAQHHELVLETGHVSAEEGLMVVREAHRRGVKHTVVTGAMDMVVDMTVPQMQQAAREGAYIEFAYSNAFGLEQQHTMKEFADAIRAIGPKSCILATNFGSDNLFPLHPQALLDFMEALHKEGISVDDINLMVKSNPAMLLGLAPYPPTAPA